MHESRLGWMAWPTHDRTRPARRGARCAPDAHGSGRAPRGVIAGAALCLLAAASPAPAATAAGAPHPSAAQPGAPPASGGAGAGSEVAKMQNAFALDLYRRLAGEPADENLFFSPYSIYAALAMTAEGARAETAQEMGRALHLPAALRRHAADAAARPWDFAPVHAGLGGIAAELRRGAGAAPGMQARVDSLRKALAGAEGAARQAAEQHDWERRDQQQALASSLAAELNELLPQVDRYELRVANALWCDARYALAPEFVRVAAAHYGTGAVRAVDYQHDAEAARGRINAWVADSTAQRIHDLLSPGSVGASTRLVLANAIWFKGEWAEEFDAQRTQEAPFRLAGGGEARAPLMNREIQGARYAAFRADGSLFPTPREIGLHTKDDPDDPKLYPGAGGFQLATLPYKGGTLSMVILLPHAPDGLAALARRLDAARLAGWIARLEPRATSVFLPRFRLEQGRGLRAPLEAMGMVRAFVDPATGQGAQFDGMAASPDPADALFASAILHKAFLEVNEKGTEAAAATAVVMRLTSAPAPKPTRPFVPTFRADRPFLFLIRDGRSGAILFMGCFAKP